MSTKAKAKPLASSKPATKSAPVAPPKLLASAPSVARPAPKPGHVRYAQITLKPETLLHATVSVNPRREPTQPGGNVGYHMMQALIKAGKAGLTWAKYKELGGRTEDIRWDVARGWASATNK